MAKSLEGIPPEKIPTHIAIIMDGNGRWAKRRGLPRLAGHRAGTENLRQIIEACVEFGVKYLTIYAFSTENWGRPADEVEGLMNIFDDVFNRELDEMHKQGVQLRHIGRLDGVRESFIKKIKHGEELTRENDRLVLNVAFNYGGRDELIHAIKQMITDELGPDEISMETMEKYLYTAGSPDPDLVIRTSGEQRISNFLLWQSAYSEWYFPEVFWPDFNREELLAAIIEYSQRDRRFGLVQS
ncbi:MAG: isoprenyl transferase [Anaerolineales bacterium]